jgi:hypothetical protein
MHHWKFQGGILAAALALAAATTRAQDLLLTGHVTSLEGEPLRSAQVFLDGMGVGGLTDDDGKYAFVLPAQRVRGQSAMIIARLIGFKQRSIEVTLTGATIGRDFALEVNPMRFPIGVPVMSPVPTVENPSKKLKENRDAARAAGLHDVRSAHPAGERELRIWTWGTGPSEIYILTNRAGVITGERYQYIKWENEQARADHAEDVLLRSRNCTRVTTGRIFTCQRVITNAANWPSLWDELESAGIWEIPSDEPLDAARNYGGPTSLVAVELWDGTTYRAWAYREPEIRGEWGQVSERVRALFRVRLEIEMWSQQ